MNERILAFVTYCAEVILYLYRRIVALETRPYGPIYAIWAEESKVDGHAGGYEWSFGDNSNTPSGEGVVIAFRSRVVALCLQLSDGEVEVELRRNASSGVHDVYASGTKAVKVDYHAAGQIYERGDVLNFRTKRANKNKDGARVVVYLACVDEGLRGLL